MLPLFAAAIIVLAITNPMGFDRTQRVSGTIALLFAAYFVGHTVHLYNQQRSAPPLTLQPSARSGEPAVNPETHPSKPLAKTEETKRAPAPHHPLINQQGQNNIAQVGNNNQATINAEPVGRLLTNDQTNSFLENIKSIAPQTFFLVYETNDRDPEAEQIRFADQLASILKAAGWVHLVEEVNAGRTKRIIPIPYIKEVSQRGIIIYAPQALASPAEALSEALEKFNLRCSLRHRDMMGGNNNIPIDFIVIEVGIQ